MQKTNEVLMFDKDGDRYIPRLEEMSEKSISEDMNGESGFHVYHVSTLTKLLLNELSLFEKYSISEEDIEAIAIASSLHDVGKVRIPESILNYPGKLSPVEYDIIKKHALFGAEIIENTDFLTIDPKIKKYAVEIAKYHHERYDGTGYPEGLVGDAIPLSAQVVALADSYDALTSNRSYKEAFSQDVAVQMVSSGMCGVFNEDLISCLLKVVNHETLLELREMIYKNRAVLSEADSQFPEHILCIGNTEYLTEDFIKAAFPQSKVMVVGNTRLGSEEKIKLFKIKKPSIKAIFETYDFDAVVYFSGDLTFHTTEKNDAEELREVLKYAKKCEREMKIIFLSSLDSSFTKKTDRSILAGAKEALCKFYETESLLDIKIIQIPFLYSGDFEKDFLYKTFEKIHNKKTVAIPEAEFSRLHFISLSDLSSLIFRIFDLWHKGSGILSVGDEFQINFADFADKVKTILPSAEFDFTGQADGGKIEFNNAGIRSEYGWFAKISVIEDLEEEYLKYCKSKEEKAETFWQKIKKWIDRHSFFIKTLELILLFILTEFLIRLTDSAVVFSIVDFRMVYIVVMATVHGLYFGLSAATLCSISWLFAKVATGTNMLTIFYEPTNWLAFVFFFLVGAICGYVKLKLDDNIRFVTEQNKLLEDKLVFTREIYEDTYLEKRHLKKQIIGSKDSFGKIFDITRRLDTVAPQQLYLRLMETFEEVLENKSITVYSVNSESTFGRLEVASRDIIDMVSRSISLDTYKDITENLKGGEIWRNTELKADKPMFAAGVFRGEELVLLVFLWSAAVEQHSLYYVNLFKILRDLAQMSLLRAFDYNKAVYEKQYVNNTRIMKKEAFDSLVGHYEALSAKKVSTYVLLELDTEGLSPEEIDSLLERKVRANDFVGEQDGGKTRLLLSQATEKDLGFILPRFEAQDLKVTILKKS